MTDDLTRPRYSTLRMLREKRHARNEALEAAAQLIVDFAISSTSDGPELTSRREGDRSGMAYATAIRRMKQDDAR